MIETLLLITTLLPQLAKKLFKMIVLLFKKFRAQETQLPTNKCYLKKTKAKISKRKVPK